MVTCLLTRVCMFTDGRSVWLFLSDLQSMTILQFSSVPPLVVPICSQSFQPEHLSSTISIINHSPKRKELTCELRLLDRDSFRRRQLSGVRYVKMAAHRRE